jgi:hypothetical protein
LAADVEGGLAHAAGVHVVVDVVIRAAVDRLFAGLAPGFGNGALAAPGDGSRVARIRSGLGRVAERKLGLLDFLEQALGQDQRLLAAHRVGAVLGGHAHHAEDGGECHADDDHEENQLDQGDAALAPARVN